MRIFAFAFLFFASTGARADLLPHFSDCGGIRSCERTKGGMKRPTSNPNVTWTLIARKTSGGVSREVWMDGNTGLWWGDRIPDGDAESGMSNFAHSCAGNKCRSSSTYNGAVVTSDWYAIGLNEDGSVMQELACDSGRGKVAKAGASGKKFGLPTVKELEQAVADGALEVLPQMDGNYYWAADVFPGPENEGARTLNGSTGKINVGSRELGVGASVRCVGR